MSLGPSCTRTLEACSHTSPSHCCLIPAISTCHPSLTPLTVPAHSTPILFQLCVCHLCACPLSQPTVSHPSPSSHHHSSPAGCVQALLLVVLGMESLRRHKGLNRIETELAVLWALFYFWCELSSQSPSTRRTGRMGAGRWCRVLEQWAMPQKWPLSIPASTVLCSPPVSSQVPLPFRPCRNSCSFLKKSDRLLLADRQGPVLVLGLDLGLGLTFPKIQSWKC